MKTELIPQSVINLLWQKFSLKLPNTSVKEQRVAVVLLSMIAGAYLNVFELIAYLMGPYNADPNLTPAPLTPALITPVSNCAEYKRSIFPLLMEICVRKLVKRKVYMLRLQYTKFRKKKLSKNIVFPF